MPRTMKQEIMELQARTEHLAKKVKALEEDGIPQLPLRGQQLLYEIDEYLRFTEGESHVPKYVKLLRGARSYLETHGC